MIARIEALAQSFSYGEGRPITEDLKYYTPNILLWYELFSHYDVIQAYSTHAIYPLLTGNKPYVAYEHGTLRQIPFQDNER